MTTMDINEAVLGAPHGEAGSLIGKLYRRWRERRYERATLIELSTMSPHLLRDMGIEPGDVRDALEGRRSSVLFNPIRRESKHRQGAVPELPARPR
ncbi:MAG: hypothetical protein JWQ89_3639 [Devosia sp.]|uniref:DUF1127 domain-containing protein n=1 Tax=Devosia sp. TaxID=1871048 RepID=UPI002623BE5E|nr:DUF1127 domain-containing protein [Devosia sp.]MDB5541912.1 hypothetical protein [Devosia sp.]